MAALLKKTMVFNIENGDKKKIKEKIKKILCDNTLLIKKIDTSINIKEYNYFVKITIYYHKRTVISEEGIERLISNLIEEEIKKDIMALK